MSNYVIYADSACDIAPEVLESWGIRCARITFNFVGESKIYNDNDIPAGEFYERMKKGDVAKTAALNCENFKACFKECADEGLDVIYIGFSSGLSTTYSQSVLAAREMAEEYPDRRFVCTDTLCASAGYGLMLSLAAKKRDGGASIDELAKYVEDLRGGMCHWFTVDDLDYLKRGGRVSPTVAFVGNLLGIKPVLHMDGAGHLVNVSKARGRRAAIAALCDKFGELSAEGKDGLVYISHAYCENDAKLLESMLGEKYGVKVDMIANIGTVIGSHSGPGTLALFFIGKER